MRMFDARTTQDIATARLTQQAVAFAFGMPVEEIAAATRRSKSAALARQTAMYLTHIAFGLNFARVADAFQRDRTTVAHACQVIEERRDDPGFDSCVDELESFLRAAPGHNGELSA